MIERLEVKEYSYTITEGLVKLIADTAHLMSIVPRVLDSAALEKGVTLEIYEMDRELHARLLNYGEVVADELDIASESFWAVIGRVKYVINLV